MRTFIITTALAATLAMPSYAGILGDTTNNTAVAGAAASANAGAIAAQEMEQRQSLDNRNTNLIGVSSENKNRNTNSNSIAINDRLQAPSMGAPSMSSGHPCAYGGTSFAISIVGGGASGGGNANKIDDACMLGQLGYTSASMMMIAARNPAARQALIDAGYLREPAKPAAPVASSQGTATPRATAHGVKGVNR